MRALRAGVAALVLFVACGTEDTNILFMEGADFDFVVSNGVRWMDGTDATGELRLVGSCLLDGETGTISCNGLVIHAGAAGVHEGIGFEVVGPVSSTCAGGGANAPAISVFSVGSLVLEPGSRLYTGGRHAIAVLAAGRIEIGGLVVAENAMYDPMANSDPGTWFELGPSGGTVATGEDAAGSGGAGGATAGGAGGSGGLPGGPAAPPQFEPLCGGSAGAHVGRTFPTGGGTMSSQGGAGGGVLLLAAADSITVGGGGSCGILAFGLPGAGGTVTGGAGGGAGGTLSIEAPAVAVAEGCVVAAPGGGGGGGVGLEGCLDQECLGDSGWTDVAAGYSSGGTGGAPAGGTGGDGGHDGLAPASGSDGLVGGGGGGGAAGFVRFRTGSCEVLPLSAVDGSGGHLAHAR